jgi:glycine C-acetyltransferase
MTQASTRPQLAHLTAALDELRNAGTHFKLRILDDQQAPVCHYDGKQVINLASNNYLGLANHPKLIEAALAATREFGVGSGAVRTIAGTMRIHMDLEEKIARFKNVEACVVFQSGFTANAGSLLRSETWGTRQLSSSVVAPASRPAVARTSSSAPERMAIHESVWTTSQC